MTMHAIPVLLGLVSDVQTTLLLVWQALNTSAPAAFCSGVADDSWHRCDGCHVGLDCVTVKSASLGKYDVSWKCNVFDRGVKYARAMATALVSSLQSANPS
jgi:hypothetical protein